MSIEGKVAVISGGGGALGMAVIRKFLSEGAKVLIGWKSPEGWEKISEVIDDKYKQNCLDMQVDMTNEADVMRFMEKAKTEFGTIDFLLHMVGMFRAGPTIWETDTEVMEQLLAVNLKSAFLSAKYGIKIMQEKGRGRFIVFPAKVVLEPEPGVGAYAISKSGLITLVRALREELKETKITANAVALSVMDTPKTRNIPNAEPEKWVKPSEVADFLANLCADECDVLNGSLLKLFARL